MSMKYSITIEFEEKEPLTKGWIREIIREEFKPMLMNTVKYVKVTKIEKYAKD